MTIRFLLAVLLASSSFAAVQAQNKHIIKVYNNRFDPNQLSTTLGDTIRWEWVEGTHTTTSISIPSGAIPWSEPMTSTNSFFEYVPVTTGLYGYFCQIHGTSSNMTGQFGVWDLNGISPADQKQFDVWESESRIYYRNDLTAGVSYRIFTVTGQQVSTGDIPPGSGSTGSALLPGVYIFTATLNDGTFFTRRFVV